MSIYTKTGDKGTTAVFGGRRVSKSDSQIEASGAIDELTSFIGWTLEEVVNPDEQLLLTRIQQSLYQIMGFLAGASTDIAPLSLDVKDFEKIIDTLSVELPPLNRFILPQGGELASRYHVVRVLCRRSERAVIKYLSTQTMTHNSEFIIQYLNRLSDLFFMLARKNTKGKESVT